MVEMDESISQSVNHSMDGCQSGVQDFMNGRFTEGWCKAMPRFLFAMIAALGCGWWEVI